MSDEETSRLPFLESSPVHMQVRILSERSGFTAYMNTDWSNWQRFRIDLKLHDIEELNGELQYAIEEVSRHFTVDDPSNKIRFLPETLLQLAYKGSAAYKRIFAEGTPRKLISEALRMGAIIQFSSEDFFVPWELLYDGPPGAPVEFSHFWGMRHIVSRALIQEARSGSFVPPIIQVTRPQIGLIACSELEHVNKKEIPMLRNLHRVKKIRLSCLPAMDNNHHVKELVHLGKFLRRNIQIMHLACHAHEMQPMSQSYLLISNHFPITIEDFRVQEFAIAHHPFVILNACLTGTISPLYTSNWAALFWERGARGVLATEFHVPDSFAAAFTEELYKHFLGGNSIGEALLTTRRHFWEQQQNPLGLAYALYASPSIRIVQQHEEGGRII